MQLSAQKVQYEPLRSLAFGSITTSYATVGTRFNNPVRILKVTNLTDANLLVSFDGVTDEDVVAANGFYLYDYGSDKADQAGTLEQSALTQLYVKYTGSAPTKNSVYVTVIYASTV